MEIYLYIYIARPSPCRPSPCRRRVVRRRPSRNAGVVARQNIFQNAAFSGALFRGHSMVGRSVGCVRAMCFVYVYIGRTAHRVYAHGHAVHGARHT